MHNEVDGLPALGLPAQEENHLGSVGWSLYGSHSPKLDNDCSFLAHSNQLLQCNYSCTATNKPPTIKNHNKKVR